MFLYRKKNLSVCSLQYSLTAFAIFTCTHYRLCSDFFVNIQMLDYVTEWKPRRINFRTHWKVNNSNSCWCCTEQIQGQSRKEDPIFYFCCSIESKPHQITFLFHRESYKRFVLCLREKIQGTSHKKNSWSWRNV